MLFSKIMNDWLELHSLSVAPPTIFNYSRSCKYMINKFGDIETEEITSDWLQSIVSIFVSEGLSNNSIINYGKVLNMSLNYAVDKKIIKKNPFTKVIMPRSNFPDVNPFTKDEVRKVLKVDMRQWVRDAMEISFRTGMRKGEIFALEKRDIDFSKKFLTVRRTQSISKNGIIVKPPKTKASIRRIDLDDRTLEILDRRLCNGISHVIFSRGTEMIIPWNISNTTKAKCRKAKIMEHRFHDFRHGHATFLLQEGIHPKIVQFRMGHSSIKMTMDIYSHLIPGMQGIAVNSLQKLKLV